MSEQTRHTLTRYQDQPAYRTKDGSTIRELLHPGQHGNRNQSLAEAVIEAGHTTQLHRHNNSEELYHIIQGSGEMTLGDQRFRVETGDTIAIPPGTPHKISNQGDTPLKILCCCAPAYAHDDTELLE